MPIIACSHCKSRFKVPIDTVGQPVECPRCSREFKAVALHSAPRKQHGTPPIVYAAIGVGAVLVVLVIALATRDSEPEQPIEKPKAMEKAPVDTTPTETRPTGGPKDILLEQARKIVEALRIGDDPLLPGWIDYPAMHEARRKAGEVDTPWTSMSEPEKYAAREECLAWLPGDAASQKLAQHGAIESAEVTKFGSGTGKVELVLKNALDETRQRLKMDFTTAAGAWKLAGLERGEIEGNEAAPEVADGPVAAPTAIKAGDAEGDVVAVPLIEVSPSIQSRIERSMQGLLDLSATVEANAARGELVEVGKPAIPHLLNALVPLDLNTPDDLLVAVRIANTLRDLTGREFAISPGLNEGSMMGEFAGDNEGNRRRWFGWWASNKDSYTGPPAITFDEDPDEDGDG